MEDEEGPLEEREPYTVGEVSDLLDELLEGQFETWQKLSSIQSQFLTLQYLTSELLSHLPMVSPQVLQILKESEQELKSKLYPSE